jgi:hypothetical protein
MDPFVDDFRAVLVVVPFKEKNIPRAKKCKH